MQITETEQNLRQAFSVVNFEANIVPPMVLEAYVDDFFREFGPDWLLQMAEQLGIASGDNVMGSADAIKEALRTQEGRARLRRCIADKQEYAGQCTEKLERLAEAWGLSENWGEPSGQAGLSSAQSHVATADMVHAFLESRLGGISDGAWQSYRHTLNPFARICPVLPTTPQEMERYFARYNGGRGAASAYPVLKLLFDFAEARYGCPNVMRSVKRPRFKEVEPASFILDQFKVIVNACQDDRELALVHLEGGHGLRPNEAISINYGDIGETDIFLAGGKVRKQFMPLLPETRKVLLRLGKGPDGAIFRGRTGKRLSDRSPMPS